MGFVRRIADHFRSNPAVSSDDQYGVLSPLLATEDRVVSCAQLLSVLQQRKLAVSDRTVQASSPFVEKGYVAYELFTKALPAALKDEEVKQPFVSLVQAMKIIEANLTAIEDHFHALFGNVDTKAPESMKASALLVLGYMEKVDQLIAWISMLAEHLTHESDELIPPFRTKDMLAKSAEVAAFVSYLDTHAKDGLMADVHTLQQKGVDVAMQTHGVWIDEIAHDSQFSPMEQSLMTASIRHPILWLATKNANMAKYRLELYNAREDWLTTKVTFEESKLHNLDPNSADYKRLKGAVEHYATLISKYEQKIERMRA